MWGEEWGGGRRGSAVTHHVAHSACGDPVGALAWDEGVNEWVRRCKLRDSGGERRVRKKQRRL
jgi:hypothetical protein